MASLNEPPVGLAVSTAPNKASLRASDALGLWEPKRTLTLEAARRHSAFIARLRWTLSVLALIIMAAVMYKFFTQQRAEITIDDPDQSVKMLEPRYMGRNSDGLPYRITAASAIRLTNDSDRVQLENPVLYFLRTEGAEESVVIAKSGVYESAVEQLELSTDVILRTDDGYVCATEHAMVFAAEKRITGNKPIECSGSFGNVTGQTYEILDDYSMFIFKDGMTGFLIPEDDQVVKQKEQKDWEEEK